VGSFRAKVRRVSPSTASDETYLPASSTGAYSQYQNLWASSAIDDTDRERVSDLANKQRDGNEVYCFKPQLWFNQKWATSYTVRLNTHDAKEVLREFLLLFVDWIAVDGVSPIVCLTTILIIRCRIARTVILQASAKEKNGDPEKALSGW
jgi:hypothetical protein